MQKHAETTEPLTEVSFFIIAQPKINFKIVFFKHSGAIMVKIHLILQN